MDTNENSAEKGIESSSGSNFEISSSLTPKAKNATSSSKDQKSPIKISPEKALNNLPEILSQEIATDTVVRVSSRTCERKKCIEKSLDSETTTASTSEKKSLKQEERATNEDIVTEDSEHIPSQNATDVPTRVSSRISDRKKRALDKALESEATNSTKSEKTNSKQKEESVKKDIISKDLEGTLPQTITDVTARVSSSISKRKKRALDKSRKSAAETSSASEEKNPKQEEKPVKKDTVTEDIETSSQNEEATTENKDNVNDSQVDKPRHNVIIKIGDKLKKVLEQDLDLINNKNKLIALPAQPTVISILESWVLDYTTTLIEKMSNKRHKHSEAQDIIDETIVNINLCREMADGIRVYFDHTLAGLLLYGVERDQCNSMMLKTKAVNVPVALEESITINDKTNEFDINIEKKLCEKHKSSSPKQNYEDEENENEVEKATIKTSTRCTLRSSCLVSVEEPKTSKSVQETKQKTENESRSKSPQEEPKSFESLDEIKQETENMSRSSNTLSPPGFTLRSFSSPINSTLVNDLTEKAKIWRLVKDDTIKSSMPSNIYGAIHLVRLFVRLPDLLGRMNLTKAKLKVVLKYIEIFLSFLESHEGWFGEQFYMLKTSFEECNAN